MNTSKRTLSLRSVKRMAMATLSIVFVTINLSFAQLINAAKIRDVSISATSTQPFEPKDTFKKVINLLDLKDSRAGVNLYTTLIGAPGVPRVNLATLPEVEGTFPSKLERNNDLGKFFKKGLHDFEYLDQEATHKQTQIYRSLVAVTSQFNPDADRTLIIIESDFVSSGPLTEFTDYARNPSSLMDDFDQIMSRFRTDSELPDLKGAEVILLTPGDNELALWSSRWWRKAFYAFGASKVSIQATL